MSADFPKFAPLGDRGLVVHLGGQIDAAAFHSVRTLARRLEAAPPRGMIELVPAFTTVAIYYDPLQASLADLQNEVQRLLLGRIPAAEPPPRRVEIPVCYGGDFGSDLEFVARHAGFSPQQTIEIHAGGEYLVHMIGFAPGFLYLGGMSPRIAAPRRSTPRLKVPAGSVGIAGEQTGIYPLETPGGWQLIGRTPLALFRPAEDPPALLQAGDIVTFRPITPEQFRALQETSA